MYRRSRRSSETRVELGELGGTDQEGEAAGGGEQVGGGGEDGLEALDGSQSDDVGLGGRQGFGAGGDYIYVRQCKGADDFAQEGGFFVIRLDQRQGDRGRPDFQRQSREASSAAKSEDTDCILCQARGKGGGPENGLFPEVAGDDLPARGWQSG